MLGAVLYLVSNLKIMQVNHLPPLEPIGDFRSYVCGNVVIDPTAAIASGVLIKADQGSHVSIAASVCIGMGTVIHAQDGLLEIEAGASLGAGVLVYGASKIGEGSCIGASSSIVRSVIAKGAIVPSCSLIVDQAEQDISPTEEVKEVKEVEKAEESVIENVAESIIGQSHTEVQVEISVETTTEASGSLSESLEVQPELEISTLVNANSAQAKAYGQSQINRYIKRIFPNN